MDQYKSLSLKELFDDTPLFSKVVSLMQRKESYEFIIKYLNSKGKSISKGSLSNLKTKMRESEEQGIPLERLLDKRRKTSIKDVNKSNIVGFVGNNRTNSFDTTLKNVKRKLNSSPVYSNQEVLETIIKKGMSSLEAMDDVAIDVGILMKATVLNQKYFGSKTGGLTAEAFKQYQLLVQAEIKSIGSVIAEFVPENKQEEAYKALDKKFKEEVAQVGQTENGQKLLKELKKAGAEF